MGYQDAIEKAWLELEKISSEKNHSVRLLADEYSVDRQARRILSLSCNVPAKEYLTILILHYLARQLRGLPKPTGEWLDFRQLDGGQGYFSAFRQRVFKPIVKKYKSDPGALFDLTQRCKAKKSDLADAAVIVEVFDGVPFLIELWRADEEFGPEANVLFDKSIKEIFCTEDVVVLSEFIAHQI